MVSEDSTCTVLLRARCLLLLLLLAADSKDRRCAVCGITFKITCNRERKQNNLFVPVRTRNNPAASNTHPHQKAFFHLWKLPLWTCELDPHERWHVGHRDCATRRTPTHLPAGIEGVRTHASISPLRTSAVVYCLASIGEWRSRSLEALCWKGQGGSDRLRPC